MLETLAMLLSSCSPATKTITFGKVSIFTRLHLFCSTAVYKGMSSETIHKLIDHVWIESLLKYPKQLVLLKSTCFKESVSCKKKKLKFYRWKTNNSNLFFENDYCKSKNRLLFYFFFTPKKKKRLLFYIFLLQEI